MGEKCGAPQKTGKSLSIIVLSDHKWFYVVLSSFETYRSIISISNELLFTVLEALKLLGVNPTGDFPRIAVGNALPACFLLLLDLRLGCVELSPLLQCMALLLGSPHFLGVLHPLKVALEMVAPDIVVRRAVGACDVFMPLLVGLPLLFPSLIGLFF